MPGAKVAVITGPPAATPPAVVACQVNFLKQAGLNVVVQTANQADSSASASQIVADLLSAHPDIQVLDCYNDSTALGASAAVYSAHMHAMSAANPSAGGIIISGGNADADALQAIQQGRMTLTWDPNNIATGFAIVYQMNRLLTKHKALPITIPALAIDAKNVATQSNPRGRPYSLSKFPGLKK